MPPLNQISKEEIEKFKIAFPAMDNYLDGGVRKDMESFVVASHLRLIDGVIEHLKGVNIYGSGENVSYIDGYHKLSYDLIKILQSEKENIIKIKK